MAEEEQMSDEEKEMMAAMEAAGSEDANETLSQDEIDSLLGFDSESEVNNTGITALLERSQENYERLPMLEVVFDRYIRGLSTSLRNFTGENVDVNVDSISSMRFEDYLNSVPLPALLSIILAVEWENYGLITIDSSLTYSMVDILLGGSRSNRPVRIEGRPFTTIEQDIIKTLSKIMLEDLSTAFNPLTPATFRTERLETNPRFATITRPANPVIVVSMRIEIEDKGGKAEILFPYATLEPVKSLLTQMFSGESFGGKGDESSWEDHLGKEVSSTKVNVRTLLDKKMITLKDLVNLQVGQTIVMDNLPNDDLPIECRGVKMMQGNLGASGNNLAVQISKVFVEQLSKLL